MTAEYSVNRLGGYIRFRNSHWEPDRFLAILTEPNGVRRRPSKRKFAKAMDAMLWRHRVEERLARMMKAKAHAETN